MNDRLDAVQQKRASCHGHYCQVSGQSYHSRTPPHQIDIFFVVVSELTKEQRQLITVNTG